VSSSPNQPTLIVGGGISGLAAAYALSKQGRHSVLIDSSARLGGVIQTNTVADCLLEAGPDSFLSAKPEAMALIKELGLGEEVIGSNDHQRATWIRRDGRMIPLPDGLMMMVPTKITPIVLSPLLSWGTKIRMGLELFRQPGPKRADRSVGEFVEEHYGKETVEYLAEPLLSGVYGGDPYKLSIESVMPRFVEMESKYGSLSRGTLAGLKSAPKSSGGTLFRTLRNGLGSLVQALEQAIAPYCEVVEGKAHSLRASEIGYTLSVAERQFSSPHLIVATPAWAAADLLRGLDAPLADLLASIGYSSSLTAGLIYDRAQVSQQFPAFGFLVPKKERKHLVACTFVDQKFNHRVPANRLLLRCFLGGAGNAAILDWDDASLQATIEEEVQQLLGITAKPIAFHVSRWHRSMAQYEVGHAGLLEQIDQRLAQHKGLALAGNGYRGIGIPDCIKSGTLAAHSFQKA
jgi:protoporphyrinogen/coproporphyrinogen III oxidase